LREREASWRGRAILLLIGRGLPACGGSTDANDAVQAAALPPGADTPAAYSCATVATQDLGLEDFESGAAARFYAFDDGTASALLEPDVRSADVSPSGQGASALATLLPSSRCGSRWGAHLRVSGMQVWGGGFGMPMTHAAQLFAAHATGVAFWARKGSAGKSPLWISLPDRATSSAPEGDCIADATYGNKGGCGDAFGAFVNLETSWQRFTIPFSELRQEGWGQFQAAANPEDLVSLNFNYRPGNYDIWIDDIALYRVTP
jgi:hypothetical protein